MPLTPSQARRHVPLASRVTYLDSAATSLTPRPVLDAMREYYVEYGVNIERGSYALAARATDSYERARVDTAELLLGCSPGEFVFTRNMTEGANMVAHALHQPKMGLKRSRLSLSSPLVKWRRGDEIVGAVFDHHSNTLPWQRLALQVGAKYRQLDPPPRRLAAGDFESVSRRTRLVVVQHVSNVLGVRHDVGGIAKFVKSRNPDCLVFVDGSQAPGHVVVDVGALGCDFYAFSGHKGPMGPKGTGGLYARETLLERMDPLILGGGIIRDVTPRGYRLRDDTPSRRFDAGTPNIPGLIGLGRAARYVSKDIGLDRIERHEARLARRTLDGIAAMHGIIVYGPTEARSGPVAFNVEGYTAHETAAFLDDSSICVRAGHHCALPLARKLGALRKYGGETRSSTHYYNNAEDVDRLLDSLARLVKARGGG